MPGRDQAAQGHSRARWPRASARSSGRTARVKQRRAFLAKQKKKLTALKRARTRCLRNALPPPGPPSPPAPPAPPAPDTTPPELRIDSPGAEAWFGEATATVSGVARDSGSGIAAVACNGQSAARNGDAFTCQVPLGEGPNTIGVTASDAAGNASAASVVVNHAPGAVSGESGATALGAVKNVDADPRHDDADVSVTPEGLRIAREEIGLHVTASATVEQVNAALQSVDGQIVGSIEGSPHLAVGIPDPGSLAALDALLATLRTQPGVARAERADMPAIEELPTGFASPPSSTGGPILSHLLAMRMPAAWNARKAIDLADRPTLIVADFFGNGPLSSQVDATYNSSDLTVKPQKFEHGYHVVGIAASGFATNGTAAGNVTGVFPATTPLHVIESSDLSSQMTGLKIFQKATSLSGRVVVNTSLGWLVPVDEAEARSAGSDWAQLVRGSSGLEDRMFHATSAGNIAGPANRNSRFSAAALRSDLENQFGLPMTPLRNTAAVENLRDTGSPAFDPGCLSTTSNRNGNIATVGEDVFSHLFGSQAGNKTGTSMASPAVAGLAMFLWSIEPTLTAPQMRELMVATARPRAVECRGELQHRCGVRSAARRVQRGARSRPGGCAHQADRSGAARGRRLRRRRHLRRGRPRVVLERQPAERRRPRLVAPGPERGWLHRRYREGAARPRPDRHAGARRAEAREGERGDPGRQRGVRRGERHGHAGALLLGLLGPLRRR